MEVVKSTHLIVNKNKTGSDDLPSSGLPENNQGIAIPRMTPLIPSAGDLCSTAQLVQAKFSMAGPSNLPWLSGCLIERLGKGYWLLFNHQLLISYELGDCIYGYLHLGRVLRGNEDTEGEITEDTVEEEVI